MRYWKDLRTCYFECFENASSSSSIMIIPLCTKLWSRKCWNQLLRHFDVYLNAKNQLHLKLLFWDIVKILQTYYLTTPSKIIGSVCSDFSCLTACKNQFHHSLLCSDIAEGSKLFILGNMGMLVHTSKMIVSLWRNLWQLSVGKNQLRPLRFPWDIEKILQTCCSLCFGHAWLCTLKMILWICWKRLCLSTTKSSNSYPMFLWIYCKDMQTYFGYFGHFWLYTTKMRVTTCRKLRFLSASQK